MGIGIEVDDAGIGIPASQSGTGAFWYRTVKAGMPEKS
jgi:hypothetical protein